MCQTRKLIVLLGIAVSGAVLAAAMRLNTIPLGTVDLTGGTNSKTVDTAALPAGSTITATVKNSLVPSQAITDVLVSVRRKGGTGTPPPAAPDIGNGGVTIGDQTEGGSATSEGDGEQAHVESLNITTGNTASASIDIASAGGTSELTVNFTPSVADKPKNSSLEASVMGEFVFTDSEDGARHSIKELFHDRFVAGVTNGQPTSVITKLTGTLFAQGQTVAGVYLQDPSSGFSSVSGATITWQHSTFEIADIELEPSHVYEVVVVGTSGFSGKNVKLQLDATFN